MARIYIIATLIVAIDQATKAFVRQALSPGDSFPVIANILHLTYVRNPGAAFGILQGKLGLLIAASIIMVAVVLFYTRSIARSEPWLGLGYSLALGGAVGNLIDRIRYGWVTDFVDFRVWPVFNVADTAIFLGVCILLWRTVILSPKTFKEGEEGA